jgi:hypothetical protein
MKYYCQFPSCTFSTSIRSQIEYHHIIPKELGGSNHHSNRIWLCPNHHRMIYIPDAQKGHHTKYSNDSIILLGWKKSTVGKVLLYKKINDDEVYVYSLNNKELQENYAEDLLGGQETLGCKRNGGSSPPLPLQKQQLWNQLKTLDKQISNIDNKNDKYRFYFDKKGYDKDILLKKQLDEQRKQVRRQLKGYV